MVAPNTLGPVIVSFAERLSSISDIKNGYKLVQYIAAKVSFWGVDGVGLSLI